MQDAEKKYFMAKALEQAKIAQSMGEVPIGCVMVQEGQIIAKAHNRREMDQKASSHAELLAIQQANSQINNWRLEHCQLFVTLEPCSMCAGAIVLARIPEVYIGAMDPKSGMVGSLDNLLQKADLNHQAYVESGILAEECSLLLKDFFKALRQRKKKSS